LDACDMRNIVTKSRNSSRIAAPPFFRLRSGRRQINLRAMKAAPFGQNRPPPGIVLAVATPGSIAKAALFGQNRPPPPLPSRRARAHHRHSSMFGENRPLPRLRARPLAGVLPKKGPAR
jgi:hypothetical protein